VALEMLGLAPCYHMVNVLGDLTEVPRWRAAMEGDTAELKAILDGFEATVDWPGSFFYKDLIELYPDAKVLLSVRDADAWARSMLDTVWGVWFGDILIRHLSAARATVDPQWKAFGDMMYPMWARSGLLAEGDTTGASLADGFRRYADEVQQTVPSDRLLVWTPADGWEPLCEFLELDVPDVPFPRLNDSKEFAERIIDGSLLAVQQHRAALAGDEAPTAA
jgi:hypothetical protein